jgi:hypothetical protein
MRVNMAACMDLIVPSAPRHHQVSNIKGSQIIRPSCCRVQDWNPLNRSPYPIKEAISGFNLRAHDAPDDP